MRGAWRALLWLLVPWLLAMSLPEFQFHRSVVAAPGPCQLELPDDVLDATRPALPDLRIVANGAEEVPFALESALEPRPARLIARNVASTPDATIALIDRGDGATWADELGIAVDKPEFMKPVVVEASADRATWARVSSGSIFAIAATGGAPAARSTLIHFAPNDRRWLRIIFDDRVGPRIVPTEFTLRSRHPAGATPARVLDLELRPASDADLGYATFTVALPAGNLPLTALRLSPADALFARKVRVYERQWFRDEASRRLLGEGTIVRSGEGPGVTELALSPATSRELEVDVERTDGPMLQLARAEIHVARRSIFFVAPPSGALELRYASPDAPAPHYDTAAALSAGHPPAFARATLGPPVADGAPPLELGAVRGTTLDAGAWREAHEIVLPPNGTVAYLDLPEGDLSDVRIIDAERRQVPYVAESTLRHRSTKVTWRLRREPRTTVLAVEGLGSGSERLPLESVELRVSAPAYFSRDAVVMETTFDARGRSGEMRLGYGQLVKTADAPSAPLRIVTDRPTQPTIEVRIDEGDNAPLTIDDVTAWAAYRRFNFGFRPGERLTLLRHNPHATAPRYDLALIAARVVTAPAAPAALGPSLRSTESSAAAATWIWVPLALAALALLFALRRTLRAT